VCISFSCYADLLVLHSFPTRRSSDLFSDYVQTCMNCSLACANCASACLKEEDLEMMRECIQRCLDCADICQLCARMEQKQSPFRSEEHTSELQSRENLVCRLLLEKKY